QLVGQGYLEKRPDPEDQRLVRVYVTPLAEANMADLETRAKAIWQDVIDKVTDAELEQLTTSFRILLAALRESREAGNKE
ncbi:MAG TPA: hypothetical protein VD902_03665, partial [Symbiobacteriaceae bacterium]|nr:hypothetical protein [Symbiobacteriaceae bacterium]